MGMAMLESRFSRTSSITFLEVQMSFTEEEVKSENILITCNMSKGLFQQQFCSVHYIWDLLYELCAGRANCTLE